MKKIIVGTIEGRHNLPVDNYIFEKVDEPNDIKGLEQHAFSKLQQLVGNSNIQVVNYPSEKPVSHIGTLEDIYLEAAVELHIYITGLTQATLAVINAAKKLHIHKIYVYHYDIYEHNFIQQKIIF